MTNIELETLTMIKSACRKYVTDTDERATPDWEQRRYEIATACMPSLVVNNADDDAAFLAVRYADALIAELKKSHN